MNIQSFYEDYVRLTPSVKGTMIQDTRTLKLYKRVICKVNEIRYYKDDTENSVVPPQEPVPVDPTLEARRVNAEMTISKILFKIITDYDALQDVMTLPDLNIDSLMSLKDSKNVPDEAIRQLASDLVIPKINLEGLTDASWYRIWQGFKSRLPGYIQQIAASLQASAQQP